MMRMLSHLRLLLILLDLITVIGLNKVTTLFDSNSACGNVNMVVIKLVQFRTDKKFCNLVVITVENTSDKTCAELGSQQATDKK